MCVCVCVCVCALQLDRERAHVDDVQGVRTTCFELNKVSTARVSMASACATNAEDLGVRVRVRAIYLEGIACAVPGWALIHSFLATRTPTHTHIHTHTHPWMHRARWTRCWTGCARSSSNWHRLRSSSHSITPTHPHIHPDAFDRGALAHGDVARGEMNRTCSEVFV